MITFHDWVENKHYTFQAIGGVFAAVANIVTLVAAPSVLISATAFFTSAAIVSLLTIIAYKLLYRLVSY